MRCFFELAGRDLRWYSNPGFQVVMPEAEVNYVLRDGDEPVATAHAGWKRLAFFDLTLVSGDGTYLVHIDTQDWRRRSVAWRSGESTSVAGFVLESEGSFAVRGWITTAGGRSLFLAPTSDTGSEYVVFAQGGPRLITVSPLALAAIGGNGGRMQIAPEAAADPELPALVGLAFALASEQRLLLHRSAPAILKL